MQLTKNKIKNILKTQDLEGFTIQLKGKQARYVVAFTDNDALDYDVLKAQAKNRNHENLTFGGWKDSKTGLVYIDLGFSTNSLFEAKLYGKLYNQKAIFDLQEMQEIRIN